MHTVEDRHTYTVCAHAGGTLTLQELLACVLANRFFPSKGTLGAGPTSSQRALPGAKEHIDCTCGLKSDDPGSEGEWRLRISIRSLIYPRCVSSQLSPTSKTLSPILF